MDQCQDLIYRIKKFYRREELKRENSDTKINKQIEDFLKQISARSYRCHLCQDRFTMTENLISSVNDLKIAVSKLSRKV